MQTQEEQYIRVIGTIHDPYEDEDKPDPFATLDVFDSGIPEKESFSKKAGYYSKFSDRSKPESSFKIYT